MSRLAVLATEIRSLQSAAMEHERDAIDLGDEHAIERAAFTEARLKTALRCYFIESEAQRAGGVDCSIHGHAILVTCPECVERNPHLRPIYESYLADVARSDSAKLVVDLVGTLAAVEAGRAHDVDPRTTLQILNASRRTA